MQTTHTHLRLSLTWAVLLLAALFSLSCRGESQEITSNNSAGNPNTSPAAATGTPADSTKPVPDPSPATVPTTPVGPVGLTSPTGQPTTDPNPQNGERKILVNNLPVTVSPAKPALTPAPDPFPPRPTPTIVMKDGKIVQEWQAPAEALNLASPVKNIPDAAKIGREYYMQRCADCHGKEGKGNGYMSKSVQKPPTNLTSEAVQANSDGELFWKITNGKSPMPANRVRFTDEQRWYIVAYLRTLKP
jgi:mono/diheme cytochrome c family protein